MPNFLQCTCPAIVKARGPWWGVLNSPVNPAAIQPQDKVYRATVTHNLTGPSRCLMPCKCVVVMLKFKVLSSRGDSSSHPAVVGAFE